MASQGRGSRGPAGSEGPQAAGESAGHALSALHPDPRIAGRLAQRLIQRRARSASSVPTEEAPADVERAGQSTGTPLPGKLQRKFEGSLGADLASVRVHTGGESAAAAQSVGARAYTVGKDIHFGAGQYDPEKPEGEELLAHEVAHTVQQGGRAHAQHKLEVGSTDDPAEHEADRAAANMVAGAPAQVSAVPAAVHRRADKELQAEAELLKEDLKELLKTADWEDLRRHIYDKASAQNVTDAKERKEGKQADLTGLGQLKTVEHFASVIKNDVKKTWSKKSVPERLKLIRNAVNKEMKDVGVPEFTDVVSAEMAPKGVFRHKEWQYDVNEKMVNDNKLSDADAEELCNTTLHEARHAEQAFLAARHGAGKQNLTADEIAAKEEIPPSIAALAVEQKFDDDTDAAVAEKGEEMFESMVTNRDANLAITRELLHLVRVDLPSAQRDAKKALRKLENPSAKRVEAAREAMNVLSTVVEGIVKEYPLYRQIPHEADAHVVGDAAGEAYKDSP